MAKSYFSDEECRRAGFSEPMIRTLKKIADLADTIDTLEEVQATVSSISEEQEDQNLSLTTLDTRIDAFETLAPFVRQDQTSAWSAATGTLSRAAYASYAAATISNPPTQAEVQAVANALQAASQALAALITDCKSNGVLT